MELPLIWTQERQRKKLVYNAELERVITRTMKGADRDSVDFLYREMRRARKINFKESSDWITCIDFVSAYELMSAATSEADPLYLFVRCLASRLGARIRFGTITLEYVGLSHE